MTVKQIMCVNVGCLLDGLESVSVLLQARLKLEFQAALVFAVDGDRSLVLTLVGRGLVRMDVSIGHAKVLGMIWISHTIRLEEKLERTEKKFSDVLGLIKLSDLEAEHRLLFWLIVQARQFKLLLAPIVHIGCDLSRIHALKRVVWPISRRHRRRSVGVVHEERIDSRGSHLPHKSGCRGVASCTMVLCLLHMLSTHLCGLVQLVSALDLVQH